MTYSNARRVAAPPAPFAGTAPSEVAAPAAARAVEAAPGRQASAGAERPLDDAARLAELPSLHKSADGRATIEDLLRYVVEVKSSDLHAKSGVPPTIRMSGQLVPLDHPVLDAEQCKEMAYAMMGEKDIATLAEKGEVDFAYSLAGVSRFRVNVHRQRGTIGIAARRILPGAPDLDELGLPPAVRTLADEHRGLLLVTGPTSSGKTTTCGAVIRHINQSRRCHIVTVEDPIEILHEDELSVVTQREVGQDTSDFLTALRAAMRQDPDVIFVGEIRDTETVKAALQAAETGHLVLATLHTTDVSETVNRIIDFYPSDQQKQIRVALAASLVGVVSQRLLPKVDGDRVPAIEVMISNGRIRDCILNPEKTHEIHDIIHESDFYGMQTFDQALINLYRAKLVTLADATAASTSPHDFHLALQQAGLIAV